MKRPNFRLSDTDLCIYCKYSKQYPSTHSHFDLVCRKYEGVLVNPWCLCDDFERRG